MNNLKQVTESIVDPKSSIHTWISSINTLNLIIKKHSPFRINPHKDIGQGKSILSCGLAISPIQAALCANEIARTAVFIKALGRAIHHVLSYTPERPTRVLYAGCGPYALLAFPLMSLFTPNQVCFTLIDIHSESLNPAQTLIESFGFTHHVSDFICADASTYQIPPGDLPDIIITETMNACLEKEPQVLITHNLCTQAPAAILIPQSISVDAYLLNPSKEFSLVDADFSGKIPKPKRDRIFLGTVFTLSKETIIKQKKSHNNCLPAGSIRIPAPLEQRYEPRLLTRINVSEKIILKDYDCSLTLPKQFPIKHSLSGGENINFYYELGKDPGLRCSVEQNNSL